MCRQNTSTPLDCCIRTVSHCKNCFICKKYKLDGTPHDTSPPFTILCQFSTPSCIILPLYHFTLYPHIPLYTFTNFTFTTLSPLPFYPHLPFNTFTNFTFTILLICHFTSSAILPSLTTLEFTIFLYATLPPLPFYPHPLQIYHFRVYHFAHMPLYSPLSFYHHLPLFSFTNFKHFNNIY